MRWQRGRQAVLAVDVSESHALNYSVSLGGVVWLSSPVSSARRLAHCGGEWIEVHEISTPRERQEVDDAFGSYEALTVPSEGGGLRFEQEFRYSPQF